MSARLSEAIGVATAFALTLAVAIAFGASSPLNAVIVCVIGGVTAGIARYASRQSDNTKQDLPE